MNCCAQTSNTHEAVGHTNTSGKNWPRTLESLQAGDDWEKVMKTETEIEYGETGVHGTIAEEKIHDRRLLKPSENILEMISKFGMFDFPDQAYPGMNNEYKLLKSGGQLYYGQVDSRGRKQGKGQLLTSEYLHVGYFYDDDRQGSGRTYFNDKQYIQSDWHHGKIHGQCTYVNESKGQTSNCFYKEGKKQGQAEEKWRNGSYFLGSYKEGLRDGKGELQWPDGNLYKGEFREGMMQGVGSYTWTDGKHYTGRWSANMMDGKGEFKWPDGRSYKGSYVKDQKEGFGTFKWTPKKWFEGHWKAGCPHGKGKLHEEDGTILEGVWENGELATKAES